MSNESLRLSTAYPGANAAVITHSMEKVQQAWDSLQAAANSRKRKLRAASEFQKFLSSVSKERSGVVMNIFEIGHFIF